MKIDGLERRSFILGMVTAFSECVAGGCKRMALSPPMSEADFPDTVREACLIVKEHGLEYFLEQNEDLPQERRFSWIVIAAKPRTLEEYHYLRRQGLSPAVSLEPFYDLLSYNPDERVDAGFDAFGTFFPKE
ncbi:MAG: hypothetical protein K5663_08185 [Clostridiales bacterium]|nr:hypothetical protein [Clostridiales bacterium]